MNGEAAEGRVWGPGILWEGVRCRQVTIRVRIRNGFGVEVTLGLDVELLQDSAKQCPALSRVG